VLKLLPVTAYDNRTMSTSRGLAVPLSAHQPERLAEHDWRDGFFDLEKSHKLKKPNYE
jgi:hypothetical protein